MRTAPSNNNTISRILAKNISYNNSPKKGHDHPYTKFIVKDPFNNRKEISNIAKGEKGVYLFEIKSKDLKYVGSSINLYNRVCSYFNLTRPYTTTRELSFPNEINP